MLKFFRGRKRSRNVLLLIFVGILTLSLVGLFGVVVSGGGAGLFRGTGGNESPVAEVADYDVTVRELKDALNGFSQQIAQGQGKTQRPDPAMTYSLYGTQVLDGLIRQKIILLEAARLNLQASDSEVQSRIRQIFSPWPGPEGYRMRLQQSGMNAVTFEEQLRASIAQEHLRSYITAGIQITPAEVEADYRRSNTTYAFRWVEANPDALRDKVQVSDADLQAHFDANRSEFKITTEQRRARYIFVDQDKAGEAIQISDDELKQEFDPQRAVKLVRISQIVLNAPKAETPAAAKAASASNSNAAAQTPTPEEALRARAQELVQRAQGTDGKAAEDFGQLARDNSQDAKTRASGGDLGWINKDDKRDSDDPLSRTFSMQLGEVTQPIKKGDKYYILKVTDRKIPGFEEERAELLRTARSRKSYSKAVEIATEAEQKFKESKNADAVTAEINNNSGAQVASVRETPLFSQGDTIPGVGSEPEFESALFDLENTGDVADRVNIAKGLAIVQYLDRREPHDPEMPDVKAKVELSFRTAKARQLAAERARQVAQAKTADEMKRIADSLGLKTDEREGLSGSDSVGPLTSEIDLAVLYKLNPGEVTREPIKPSESDTQIVATMISRKDADMGEPFKTQRGSIEQRLLDEKRNIYFTTYLEATQKQMKESGEIKIYDDVIASAIGVPSTPTGLPSMPGSGGMPGFPPGMPGAGQQRRAPRTAPLPATK
ncbi:MAG TPA: SurA N-terminal domain-containing protein [Blastocatellia bacterium]|nr:SurA N-terminal domain-containing protein [Blastocatellia bacterium]